MGADSTLGDYVDCYSVARVVLGAKACVSQRAFICTAQRDIDAIEMPLVTGEIVINDLAWIAAEAFVAPGVEVGTGGVVAARAVATQRVPDWTVVGGNPAKPIRDRRRQQTD